MYHAAVLPKEKLTSMLVDMSETETPQPRRPTVYGAEDKTFSIAHKTIPQDDLLKFLDGFITGWRNEIIGEGRHYTRRPKDINWQYGYDLGMSRTVYPSQAIASFFIWLES